MTDLFFKHDVTIALDGAAIDARAGEVIVNVPPRLAAVLLRRPDVITADPALDVRRFEFSEARRHPAALVPFISPPQDLAKLVADEKLADEAEKARLSQAARAAKAKAELAQAERDRGDKAGK